MNTNLIELKRTLTTQELEIFRTELERKKRSVGIAYLLWFFLSFLGMHKFYLGKTLQGFLYMIGPWVGIIVFFGGLLVAFHPKGLEGGAMISLVGALGLLCFAIWWFIDLFTLNKQTERFNAEIEKSLILQIKGINGVYLKY